MAVLPKVYIGFPIFNLPVYLFFKLYKLAEKEEALQKNKILMECLFFTQVSITEISRFPLTGLSGPQ